MRTAKSKNRARATQCVRTSKKSASDNLVALCETQRLQPLKQMLSKKEDLHLLLSSYQLVPLTTDKELLASMTDKSQTNVKKNEMLARTRNLTRQASAIECRKRLQIIARHIIDLKGFESRQKGESQKTYDLRSKQFAYDMTNSIVSSITLTPAPQEQLRASARKIWDSDKGREVRRTTAATQAFFRDLEECARKHIRNSFLSHSFNEHVQMQHINTLSQLNSRELKRTRQLVIEGKGKLPAKHTSQAVRDAVLDVAELAAHMYVALIPALTILYYARALKDEVKS